MTDPSSQNPSDQDKKPDSESESPSPEGENKPSQPKLKLKQLLTPISPHLKTEHKEDEDEEEKPYRPKMEMPRAVPIDPEPELQPHERPPPGAEDPLTTGDIEPGAPVPPPAADIVDPGAGAVPEKAEVTENVEETEQEEDETRETLVADSKQKRPGRLRKLILPLVLILAVVAGVQYFIDPLGLSPDPVQNPQPTVQTQPEKPILNRSVSNDVDPEPVIMDFEGITVDSFIQLLQKQEINVLDDPKGAIVNSVFYTEGSVINKQLDLIIESVQSSDRAEGIVIMDGSGKRYEIPAN